LCDSHNKFKIKSLKSKLLLKLYPNFAALNNAMAGLYIHIPFCKQACHYCDFHFSTSHDAAGKEEMVNALGLEMQLQKDYLAQEPIDTIYFGGGTPSILSSQHLQNLFDSIRNNFFFETAEITLEANPDDLTEENLVTLKEVGVNRLSIGIQTFDDSILKYLNRAHTAADSFHCMDLARKVGFENISIDLMYAIPGQNDDLWKENIERAVTISPEHISAYALTIEEKTVFGNWQKKGKFSPAGEETAATQMEILMDMLSRSGYQQYEISNFSKPDFHSRHNSSYWKQKKYLGIGPSAHSYNGDSRQYNISNNAAYIQSIRQERLPFQLEILTEANKINEYLFTTLRTMWGCNLDYLKTHFTYDLLTENRRQIDMLLTHGLVQLDDSILSLTQKGKLLADKIASDLFAKE
jgi:oxygen-independent coproporphyrinogen-3 oxidase